MERAEAKNVQQVYEQLLENWNNKNAYQIAELFREDGESIGFDGSQSLGRQEVFSHLHLVFEQHDTPRYIGKVKKIHFLRPEIAILRAIAGIVLPGQHDISPSENAHHTLVMIYDAERWEIQLFQNTPAQFHGRPELSRQMTDELRQLLK